MLLWLGIWVQNSRGNLMSRKKKIQLKQFSNNSNGWSYCCSCCNLVPSFEKRSILFDRPLLFCVCQTLFHLKLVCSYTHLQTKVWPATKYSLNSGFTMVAPHLICTHTNQLKEWKINCPKNVFPFTIFYL